MEKKISLNAVYVPSKNVVAREIQGEFLLIPIISGMGPDEDVIFTLNETGRLIWDKVARRKSIKNIVSELSSEFNASGKNIQKDVFGFLKELLKRKIVVRA